jgi:hypothetical protein
MKTVWLVGSGIAFTNYTRQLLAIPKHIVKLRTTSKAYLRGAHDVVGGARRSRKLTECKRSEMALESELLKLDLRPSFH